MRHHGLEFVLGAAPDVEEERNEPDAFGQQTAHFLGHARPHGRIDHADHAAPTGKRHDENLSTQAGKICTRSVAPNSRLELRRARLYARAQQRDERSAASPANTSADIREGGRHAHQSIRDHLGRLSCRGLDPRPSFRIGTNRRRVERPGGVRRRGRDGRRHRQRQEGWLEYHLFGRQRRQGPFQLSGIASSIPAITRSPPARSATTSTAPKAADIASGQPATADVTLKKTKNLPHQLTNAEWMLSVPGTRRPEDQVSSIA